MMKMTGEKCICCEGIMRPRLSDYTYYCNKCGYWSSDLVPQLESSSLQIDDGDKKNLTDIDISHLDVVRVDNFLKIIDFIEHYFHEKSINILDIGCGTGLFLETLVQRGYTGTGIEPNLTMFNAANALGLDVRKGFFPEILEKREKFDIIILNDVFEHLTNAEKLLSDIPNHLSEGGILLLNVPNSKGILFHLAKLIRVIGLKNPWDRLWQKMFYTPHLHYFSAESLGRLLAKHKYVELENDIKLRTISLKGLWKRISVDPETSLIQKLLYFLGAYLAFPIIALGKPDSIISSSKYEKLD